MAGPHVGIIPDGGRRWARREGRPLVEAYEVSFERLAGLVERCESLGCSEVSVYVLSRANLGRAASEVEAVASAFPTLVRRLTGAIATGAPWLVRPIGDPVALPRPMRDALLSIPEPASQRPSLVVNLLAAYDAWDELATAGAQRQRGVVSLADLWVTTPVDAVVRTAGGILLSGFLPLQSQYAQIVATPLLFNDLSDTDLAELLGAAVSCAHRFGL